MTGLGRRQVFAGSLLGAAGAWAPAISDVPTASVRWRPWQDLLASSATSVLEFIPAGLHAAIRDRACRTDLALYVNTAIRHVLSQPGGGTLFFPRGAYEVSEIDATNSDSDQFATTLRLVGEGRFASIIRPAIADAVLLNAAGRNGLTIQSLHFDSTRFASQAAIYLCRTQASPNCNNNRFFDMLVSGNYSRASVVAIAAESTTWLSCRFENANTNARHRCFATANHPKAAPVATRTTIAPLASSNTDNVMMDCEFYAPYNHAAPILFAGAAAYTMQACTVITGEATQSRLVTYRPIDRVFNGPVTWMAPHFEVFGTGNIVHFLEAPHGVSYFRSIHSLGGNYVVGSNTELLSFDAVLEEVQPVLMASTWTVPASPWNARNLRFHVYGLSDSAIDLRIGDGVGEVDIIGYAANSRIEAARRAVAKVVTSESRP